jgi:multiple sugar transport system permease protein
VLIIPSYLILERLGWLDTYAALVVPFTASVFAIFLLRQFFMTAPGELWDAARIDGAGHGAFLWRILVPQAGATLGTIGLLTFLGQWNALMWPLIVTTRPELRTLMVGLEAFGQEAGSEMGQLMAAATFTMLPILVAFFVLQRLFIQSVARTGLKG